MKKARIITSIIFILLFQFGAKAQSYENAVGIRFSTNAAAVNNGITFKHFFDGNTAVEGIASFDNHFTIGALLEKHQDLSTDGLTWFYGAGAYVGFGGRRNLGAQGIVGIDYKFSSVPINLAVDWKPELNLFNHVSFEPAVIGISGRFTF